MPSQQYLCEEVVIRIVLLIIYTIITNTDPFVQILQPEEIWRHKYPRTKSYFPANYLWFTVITVPLTILFINYTIQKNYYELRQAILSYSIAFELNGIITVFLKNIVGKLRPDFYWRCFPYGFGNIDLICRGNQFDIKSGRRSFPSGHASFAFTSLGFVSLYLSSKLHVFNSKGRGQSWRLLVSLLPLFVATAIGISRICDYHHDATDVVVGALIGLICSSLCYFQYFPDLSSPTCNLPFADQTENE